MRKEKALPDSRNCLRRAFSITGVSPASYPYLFLCVLSRLTGFFLMGRFLLSLQSLHAQAELSDVLIKVNNLRRNLLTDGNNI